MLANCTCIAQFNLAGIVVDSATKNPVPYSLILTGSHKFGVIANSKGEFELSLPDSLSNNYLVVSSMGYDTTIVSINSFLKSGRKEISINHKTLVLAEVSISSIEQKSCVNEWGAKRNHSFGGFPCVAGDEVAVFIANSTQDSGIISTLKFFITDEGFPTTPFRAKLYRVNPKNNAPGELMTDQDFILSAEKGNEWVVIDISKYGISIPKEGFFVSMEWLPDSKNHTYNINSFSLNTEIEKNGQALGTNKEIKSGVTWIKTFLHNWGYQGSDSNFNAMIGAGVLINCK